MNALIELIGTFQNGDSLEFDKGFRFKDAIQGRTVKHARGTVANGLSTSDTYLDLWSGSEGALDYVVVRADSDNVDDMIVYFNNNYSTSTFFAGGQAEFRLLPGEWLVLPGRAFYSATDGSCYCSVRSWQVTSEVSFDLWAIGGPST